MSGIAAIYYFGGSLCDLELLGLMMRAMKHRGVYTVSWMCDSVGLSETCDDGEKRTYLVKYCSGCVCVADARLSNQGELRSIFSERGVVLCGVAQSDYISCAYEVWGVECLRHLAGDFAFVIWDHESWRLFVARSLLGAPSLVYHCDGLRLLVASEARQLLLDPDVATGDIKELQPGHCLITDRHSIKVDPF